MMRKPNVDPKIADFVKRVLVPLLADKVLGELRKNREVDRDSSTQVELDKSKRVPE